MPFLTVALFTVALVALLSRDHDVSASQETVVTAELNLDDGILAVFPDRIRLSRCSPASFTHPHEVGLALEALRVEGFTDPGRYAIDEMPGVCVLLVVNRHDGMYAVVYDHARAGAWVELHTRYLDGRRWIHSTLASEGFEPRPQTTLVSLPGVTMAELLARARGDRPRQSVRPVNRLDVAPVFEQSYADWIAWRRSQGARPGLALVPAAAADEDMRRAA